jgi:hypothetical protein
VRALEITGHIQDKLLRNLDGELPDLSAIKVYEATAVSTAPLSKRGTLWDKATISASTLFEMAAYLNNGGDVPLHTSHQQGAGEMPVGRVFYAEVNELLGGESELRVLLYLQATSELTASIEDGILNNLSVGLTTKSMLCSECGWDYLGAEADVMNFYDRVCGNGHQLDANGTHIRAIGLDSWLELSLVSKGASKDAKIVSRTKARLSNDQTQRLAASGIPVESLLLIATNKDSDMDAKEFLASLEASSTKLAIAGVELSTAQASVASLTESNTAQAAQIATLEAAAAANVDVATVQASLDVSEARVTEMDAAALISLTFLQEQVVKVLVASGVESPVAPDTAEACIEAFEAAKLSIVSTFPVGGVALSSETVDGASKVNNFAAYTAR